MLDKNTTRIRLAALAVFGGAAALSAQQPPKVKDAWSPAKATQVGGLLGERLEAWRNHRLWRVGRDPFLLSGFEQRPGTHSYQGEHVGKWLHAAALAWEDTRDPKLLKLMEETVRRLTATQESNGYLGTYIPAKRFYAPPDADSKRTWDVWTHRYNLYGLLAYEQFHPNPQVLRACVRMGDLLWEAFGPSGPRKITEVGTRHGMSSATILESLMMLYERSGERRFLELAQHIVRTAEENENFRLLGAMLAGDDVSKPGDGKAYQLMANLLGFLEIYRHTGDARYRQAAVKGWENIRAAHLYPTGGPWSYQSRPIQNKECFSEAQFFDPTNVVETCSTTTWVQLCLSLLRTAGEARYGAEAERAVLNHLMGAQAPNGNDWAYFTWPNCARRPYEDRITCCASSGPRALEMFARHLAAVSSGTVSLASYFRASVPINGVAEGAKTLAIEGNYPVEPAAALRLDLSAPAQFAIDFAPPGGDAGVTVTVDGTSQKLETLATGHRRLRRTWKPGEKIEVRFDFPLRAHFQKGRDGASWVGFTWGPFALAEDLPPDREATSLELTGKPETGAAAEWLEAVKGTTVPTFRHKSSKTLLVPYYLAGSTGGGVRALFPFRERM